MMTSCTALVLMCVFVLLLVLFILHVHRGIYVVPTERFASQPRVTTVVGIGGNPCAGKTTLARNLHRMLTHRGFRTKIISQDQSSLISHLGISIGSPALCRSFFETVKTTRDAGDYDFLLVEGASLLGKCGSDSLTNIMHVVIQLCYNSKRCFADKRRKWYNPEFGVGIAMTVLLGLHKSAPHSKANTYHIQPGEPQERLITMTLREVLMAHHRNMVAVG